MVNRHELLGEDLLNRLRAGTDVEEAELGTLDGTAASAPMLGAAGVPVLQGAGEDDASLRLAGAEEEDDDDGGAFAGTWEPPPMAADAAGPSAELLRALDIDLPSGEGQWDDAELERVVRAMDEHYGDVPPALDSNPDAGVDNEEYQELLLGLGADIGSLGLESQEEGEEEG